MYIRRIETAISTAKTDISVSRVRRIFRSQGLAPCAATTFGYLGDESGSNWGWGPGPKPSRTPRYDFFRTNHQLSGAAVCLIRTNLGTFNDVPQPEPLSSRPRHRPLSRLPMASSMVPLLAVAVPGCYLIIYITNRRPRTSELEHF